MAGQKSKFAVLRIDDDSDSSDDGFKQKPGATTTTGKGKATAISSKNKNGPSGGGGLIVHAVQSTKANKSKKSKKKPTPITDENGFLVQDDAENLEERRFKEDLREALKLSRHDSETAVELKIGEAQKNGVSVTTGPTSSERCDPTDALLADIDAHSASLLSEPGGKMDKTTTKLVGMWRARLVQTTRQLQEQSLALVQAQNETKKYKTRYKKICELLKDTEVKEKAQMVVDLDRARVIEAELSEQVADLQGQLMQAKSKNNELEAKLLAATRK